MKYSWQRQIILETIQEHKEHLSAQQIYGYACAADLRLCP